MLQLYPLKFKTIFKDKIWGGSKIKNIIGKDFSPLSNCGETWEISGIKDNVSVVANGPLSGKDLVSLIDQYQDQLLGKRIFEKFGNNFPLLIKFIDANDDLSIQVHPDDQLAQKRQAPFGKTEMWYILQADEDACLISGFNRKMNKETFSRYLADKNLEEILNREKVQTDDVFFLPSGRIHTIGKGILLVEIQQSSDLTYRVYDFNRKDAEGNTRELHIEKALDALDYKHYSHYKESYEKKKNQAIELVSCSYFTVNRLHLDKPLSRDFSDLDGFKIYVCMQGSCELKAGERSYEIKKGDSVLVPATWKKYQLEPQETTNMLESYVTKQ